MPATGPRGVRAVFDALATAYPVLDADLRIARVRGVGRADRPRRLPGGADRRSAADAGLGPPVVRDVGDSSLGGRGMAIVAMLATDWGSRDSESGKVVWFELVPEPAGQPGKGAARRAP